jgi:hypothetical protein
MHQPAEEHLMNVFATNTTGCQIVAQRTIADRIEDAQRRAAVRAVKAERRAERRAARAARATSYDDSARSLPSWAFRFVHTVH